MKVFIDDKPHLIEEKNILGKGGEGIVAKLPGGVACKVYHAQNISSYRAKKLEKMVGITGWPSNILAPQKLVFKKRDDKAAVGFTMPIAKGENELYALGNRKTRKNISFTAVDIFKICLDAKKTLDTIHDMGVVVGDLNDLGIFYTKDFKTIWIDVDSFQISGFPCVAASEIFLDPNLYGKDFDDGKAYFSTHTDYYAFAVILFKLLFIVHPYGGIHKQYKDIIKRASASVSIMDSSVRYPKQALPLEMVSDDLLSVFDKYFTKRERPNIKAEFLKEQIQLMIECKSCGLWFSSTRKTCPACQSINKAKKVAPLPQKLTKVVKVDNVEFKEWFYSQVPIVHFRRFNSRHFAWITFDGKTATVHRRKTGLTERNDVLKINDTVEAGSKFSLTEETAVISNRNTIKVYDNKGNKRKELETGMFGRNPVVTTSRWHIYRRIGLQILRTPERAFLMDDNELRFHLELREMEIASALENQTWIRAGGVGPVVLLHRMFNTIRWEIYRAERREQEGHYDYIGGQVQLKVPAIPVDSRLVDVSVKFSVHNENVLVLRKVIHADGTEHIYKAFLERKRGSLLHERISPSTNLINGIHGRDYVGSMIFHPTDEGLVIEDFKETNVRSFLATADFIDADSTIYVHDAGVVSCDGNRVGYLEIVKGK